MLAVSDTKEVLLVTKSSKEVILLFLRTQLKKFLGKSVKRARHLAEEYGERAVNKVKSVRDEGW